MTLKHCLVRVMYNWPIPICPAAVDSRLRVSSCPASTSVCMCIAGTSACLPIRDSAIAQRSCPPTCSTGSLAGSVPNMAITSIANTFGVTTCSLLVGLVSDVTSNFCRCVTCAYINALWSIWCYKILFPVAVCRKSLYGRWLLKSCGDL